LHLLLLCEVWYAILGYASKAVLWSEGLRCVAPKSSTGELCLYLWWLLHLHGHLLWLRLLLHLEWICGLTILRIKRLLLLLRKTHARCLLRNLEALLLETSLLRILLLHHWLGRHCLLVVFDGSEQINQWHTWVRLQGRRWRLARRCRCWRRLRLWWFIVSIRNLAAVLLRLLLGEILPAIGLKVLIIEVIFQGSS
jgi:hypothetical protein